MDTAICEYEGEGFSCKLYVVLCWIAVGWLNCVRTGSTHAFEYRLTARLVYYHMVVYMVSLKIAKRSMVRICELKYMLADRL